MENEYKDLTKGLKPFEDYAEFEAYALKRMKNEIGTNLEGDELIKATSELLEKITEEHKDYLERVREICSEARR